MTRYTFGLLAMLWLVGEPTAWADKLDDFKEAAKDNSIGCPSIPYSNLRKNCEDLGGPMHEWCDGAKGPVSCDVTVTGKLQEALVREQKNIEELKQKRHDLDDKRSHASDNQEKSRVTSQIEAVDKDIEASTKKIENLKGDLSKRNDLVEKTMSTINKCLDYRLAVQSVFGTALDKVRNENDPAIKPHAEKLYLKYKESNSGHEEQIKVRNAALKICKDEIPRM
jgi:hypothetical protein